MKNTHHKLEQFISSLEDKGINQGEEVLDVQMRPSLLIYAGEPYVRGHTKGHSSGHCKCGHTNQCSHKSSYGKLKT